MCTDLYDFWCTTLQVNIKHILINCLLCHVSRTSLTWWRNVDVNKITTCTWHWNIATEINARVHPREMWPPNSPNLNPVDYSICGILQEGVYRSRIHDVKESKERLLRERRLLVLDHSIIVAAIAQWHSRLLMWMVDILNINFEPMTFWCVLFIYRYRLG